MYKKYTNVTCKPHSTITNTVPTGNFAYTPGQISTAYGVNLINTGSALKGAGITVAVIVAYNYTNLQADFNQFCTNNNLPQQTLRIINFGGNIRNNSWALETCLDVQTIHGIAPGAQIMVVQALSNSYTDLSNAIIYASKNGANIISMSFGGNEFQGQLQIDSIFSNTNICYVCSSGDVAATLEYPSASANVLSVGGTSLYLNHDNTRLVETTWNGGGSGPSLYIPKPAYQNSLSGNKRITPDIASIANISTAEIIYCSLYGGNVAVGGTSLACPTISGILAITNQLRKLNNKPLLTTVASSINNCVQQMLYNIYNNKQIYSSDIYDVTIGTDGKYNATVGYDICTGLGSCIANNLCKSLS